MYLGYYGENVKPNSREYDWLTSKFGGVSSATQSAIYAAFAAYQSSVPISGEPNHLSKIAPCICCNKPLSLIAQVHAPRSLCSTSQPLTGLAAIAENSVLSPNYKPPQGSDDEEARTLLVFACNRLTCHKLGKTTWRAYRFQPKVIKTAEEEQAEKDAKAAAFRKTLQSTSKEDPQPKSTPKKSPAVIPPKNVFTTPTWGSPFGGKSSFGKPTTSSTTDSSTGPIDLNELLKLRYLSLNPTPTQTTPAKDTKSEEANTTSNNSKDMASSSTDTTASDTVSTDTSSSNTLSELISGSSSPLPNTTTTKKSKVKKTMIPTGLNEDDMTGFQEAYIEFDKEPEIVTGYSGSYEEIEITKDLSEGTDGSWANEGYESSVSAKDKPFHRFHKRLQRAPEQCIRYWRGAEPLFCSTDKPKTVAPCAHCGAPRVPELQLTPALIYLLQPLDTTSGEKNFDFGTAIVYTCSVNCTSETQPLFVEHITLQKGM